MCYFLWLYGETSWDPSQASEKNSWNFSRKRLYQRRKSLDNILFEFSEMVSMSLLQQGISLNSFCDQKQYIGRSVYYWKKTLLSLKTIKKHKSIPEPTDPLFKHFRSVDIQVQIDYSKIRVRGVVCHKLTYELVGFFCLVGFVCWCFSFCHCTTERCYCYKTANAALW